MSSILTKIVGSLLVYRYLVLFFVPFFSSLGAPLPAGPTAIAAGAFASQRYLNIYLVIIIGALGNIAGDFVLYGLVYRFGLPVLRFVGLGKYTKTLTAEGADTKLDAYRASIIIISRFQVQATALVNIVAGLTRMKFRHFALYVVIGETVQMLFYTAIGYIFAASWEAVYGAVGKLSWVIILVTAIVMTLASGKVLKKLMK